MTGENVLDLGEGVDGDFAQDCAYLPACHEQALATIGVTGTIDCTNCKSFLPGKIRDPEEYRGGTGT